MTGRDFDLVKDLAVYLNDHLAGSVAAIELLDYFIKDQTGQPLEKFLTDLRHDIKSDQQSLEDLIHKLDFEESSVRKAGAWVVEKFSQAKFELAGTKLGDLGLVQALEALALGITGKRLLWCALATVEGDLPKVQGMELTRLERRAQEQFERVEIERLNAARGVFS